MILRPLEPEDLDLLYTIENDPELWDCSNTNGPYSRYALKNYIASIASIYECGSIRFVIEHKFEKSTQPHSIGLIDLVNFDPICAKAEVCIAILKKYRGLGLGFQALQQMEHYAKKQINLHSIYALVEATNTPSLHLFKKSDYKQVALLPEWIYAHENYQDVALFQKIFQKK